MSVQTLIAQKATPVNEIDGLFYTVQIGSFSGSNIPDEFKAITELNVEALPGNRFRYSTGIFRDIKFARARREELLNADVKGAFVIAYEKGERVSLRELRQRVIEAGETTNDPGEMPSLVTLPQGETGRKQFDFNLKSGDVLSEVTREVSDLFENQILDYTQSQIATDTNSLNELFQMTYDTIDMTFYDSAYNMAVAKQLRGDVGLGFNSWYIWNSEPGFGPNEDVFFMQRWNLTVDMDLLNSGLYENRTDARIMENNAELASLRKKQIQTKDRYKDLYNYIIYIFNNEKLEAIDERINLLNRQVQIIEMLYSTKNKTWEEVIELKSRISRAETMYKKWQNYNTIIRDNILTSGTFPMDFDASKLPILEPQPEKMFKDNVDSNAVYEQMLALQIENIDLEHKRINNLTLRPFARYNFVAQDNPFDQTFASLGLIFRMPINFKGPGETKRYQKEMLEHRTNINDRHEEHELLNYYYEYSYKYEQLIEFYYTRFRIEERLRREIIKYQFGDIGFSPLLAIQYMDELLANKLEVIDLKQSLYLNALKISEYMEEDSPLAYCNTVDPGELLFKYGQKRSTYIWSKFFNAQDNLFLTHYLKNNEFKKVFISPGPEPMVEKLMEFNKLASKHHISSLAMIGDNKLAIEVDSTELTERLQTLLDLGFKGFHFDIEPQTFPDWEGNQEFYISNIEKVLRIANSVLAGDPGYEVSASIPVYYPEFALNQLYPLLDEAYLMAYERPDIEFITRKTSEERMLYPGKTIISVRTKDFPNRLVMEKFIELLDEELNLERIAIHDLGTLFELDYESSMN
jgi:hypothetical protein